MGSEIIGGARTEIIYFSHPHHRREPRSSVAFHRRLRRVVVAGKLGCQSEAF